MALVERGRSIGVRIYVDGERTWIGSVSEACERCDGLPRMCAECQATARIKAIQLEKRSKQRLVYKRESCASFAGRWTRDFNHTASGKPRWDASSLRNYHYILRAFADRFGDLPLRDVDPAMARSYAKTRPAGDARALRAMFNDAKGDELIDRNPFDRLGRDTASGRRNIVAITEDELILLCELAAVEHPGYPTFPAIIAVAGYTGIRPGELFALEPSDVREDELDVRYQWNGFELKRPKSKKPRTVVLPREAAPYLAALPSYLGAIRVPREDGAEVKIRPIFRTKQGRLFGKGSQHRYWRTVASRFEAKLSAARAQELRDAREGEAMDLYELRHFAATEILRRGGTYDDAAHQLGHKDTTLIRSTYGHLEDTYKLDRVKRLYGQNVSPLRRDEEAKREAG